MPYKNKEQLKEYQQKYSEINKEKIKEYKAEWYQNNKKEINEIQKENHNTWVLLNKEKTKEHRKKYVENNKEKIYEKSRKYKRKNRDKLNEYQKEYIKKKIKTDPLFKIKKRIRGLISNSLRRKDIRKNTKTQIILGCTFEEFKQHLESMFEPWMSWDNYGLYNGTEKYGWDIDHIVPNDSAINEEGVIVLNHYTNLQPLCSYINRVIKRNN